MLKINGDYEESITHLMLYRPIEILRRVNIIDTPGLNETAGLQEELIKQVVEIADAVIYTFVPNSPLSMTEQMFLRTLVLARTSIDLFVVCNKTDMIEAEDQETFRNWMNDRVVDILRGILSYYVSALDEICRKNGEKRPNPDVADCLRQAIDELRQNLEYLIEKRSEMAMPNRVNQIIEAMRVDIEESLIVMEQGATMSEMDLVRAEEQISAECSSYENTLSKLQNKIRNILDGATINTQNLMNTVLDIMKRDTQSLGTVDKDDLIRYYPFFCMDKLQDSLDLCFSSNLSKIMEILLDEYGEDATQILDQNTNADMKLSFHIDNQTWTKEKVDLFHYKICSRITSEYFVIDAVGLCVYIF